MTEDRKYATTMTLSAGITKPGASFTQVDHYTPGLQGTFTIGPLIIGLDGSVQKSTAFGLSGDITYGTEPVGTKEAKASARSLWQTIKDIATYEPPRPKETGPSVGPARPDARDPILH
jgi:hypothetical protein